MTIIAPTTASQIPSSQGKRITQEKVLQVLQRICDIALILFALYAAPHLFVPGFLLGYLWILFSKTKKEHCQGNSDHGCSQGYLERLAGLHFPPWIRLGVEFVTLVSHISHHAPFFSPLVGFTAGVFSGKWVLTHAPRRCGKPAIS